MGAEQKKKVFPKLQKKIKGFLTDESGKISKKDALGLSLGALLLGGIDSVGAVHNSGFSCPTSSVHASNIVNGHSSGIPSGTIAGTPDTAGTGHTNSSVCTVTGNHGSGLVN